MEEQSSDYKRYGSFCCGDITKKISGLVANGKHINDKQKLEAKSVGLECVSKTTNQNYNLYKHKDCGHKSYFQPTHVRRNNIKCHTCFMNNLSTMCSKTGTNLIHHVRGNYYKLIRDCGHEVVSTASNIENYSGNCNICFDEKLKTVSLQNGYEYISKESGGYRKIRFNNCGHEKVSHQSQLQLGNVVCQECELNTLIYDAEKVGLRFINILQDGYALYHLPCGCHREIRIDKVRLNSWICQECDKTYYNQPSNVYLYQMTDCGFSWLKLGFSKDSANRVKFYGNNETCEVELLCEIKFDTGYSAKEFEKNLHRKYSNQKLNRVEMKKYHNKGGFTECYPLTLKVTLLDELKGKNE